METGRYRLGDRLPPERHLAEMFQLSRPTVSHAVQKLVAEKLIRRTGRDGTLVTDLPPQKPMLYGLLILDQGRPTESSIFTLMAREILRCAEMAGAGVMQHDPSTCEDPRDPSLLPRYESIVRQFIHRGVDGVLMMPQIILPDQYVSATASIMDELKRAEIPAVLIDSDIVRYPDRSEFDWVGIDNFSAGYALARHFLKLGCRKIDFFAIDTRHPTQEARIAGYLRAMEDFNIRWDADNIHHCNTSEKEHLAEILRRRRPDAILVVNDFQAALIIRYALGAGIAIPGAMRVGSFDDLPMAGRPPVPLTTVRQPMVGLGAAAYWMLVRRINNPELPPMHVELNGELVIRDSSGTRKTADPSASNQRPMIPRNGKV